MNRTQNFDLVVVAFILGIAAGLILSLWWRAAQVQQKSRDENRFSEAPACRRITPIPNQGEENGY